MPNFLTHETSPYLRQHLHNPVNWYAWCPAAFAAAQAADKPIFLSIGYAACHWCHVMEAESFTDLATAELLNAHFIAIKVDREERPDVDAIYMSAVVAMTQAGGWPLSVWLTPTGVPFYGGTYFPPTPRYGRPSFTQVLNAIANTWQHDRDNLLQSAASLNQHLQESQGILAMVGNALAPQHISDAVQKLVRNFDWQNGGWGQAPKFPQPQTLRFLMAKYAHNRDPLAAQMAERTLAQMALGGIYDQLGGGFHRYAVDAHWLVPHFEKMLYDNAQLIYAYTHFYQQTGDATAAAIAQQTADYVLREMQHPAGGFYSSQDADSEGEEGKFFIWTTAEIAAVLDNTTAQQFMHAYDITIDGNFEHRNIPNRLKSKIALPAADSPLDLARQTLLAQRNHRQPPATDDKVLTAWNGMMIGALAQAGRALQQPRFIAAAERAACFLRDTLRTPDQRWLRTWRAGVAKLNGYLEDYAYLADGLLDLYQSTWDEQWFWHAYTIAEQMLTHFAAETGFYDTSHDHETLLVRPQDLQDNATPSGNAMATTVLLRLAAYTGETRFAQPAHTLLDAIAPALAQYPTAFGQWLYNATLSVHGLTEIAIIGDPHATDTQALLAIAQAGYRPFQVVAVAEAAQSRIPLLRDRPKLHGQATAYVCRNFACQQPVTAPQQLAALLAQTH